ncbi:hypothetical protein BGP_4017 [Beggiatoa sp. PS]|nr:hypothetical protein BGP_4017 [Beggiatoa sp. PS]
MQIVGNKKTLPTYDLKCEWWATKRRYPPYDLKCEWWATKRRYRPLQSTQSFSFGFLANTSIFPNFTSI